MIIDVFKDQNFFKMLQPYNKIIWEACKTATFAREGEEYDLPNNKVSYWFNPNHLRELHISKNYPKKTYKVTKNKKFKLLLYFPNYISLYLINLLYKNRKDVLIEDMACGMARFAVYLRQLGFTNFHFSENFSQVSEALLKETMKLANINYSLNQLNIESVIINLVSWTQLTRNNIPSSAELLCLYNRKNFVIQKDDGLYVVSNSGAYKPMKNFKLLCTDVDELMNIYCRDDKYEEFSNIIIDKGLNQ